MPDSLYRYLWETSRFGQIVLCALTVLLVPLGLVPIELQRRIVDHAIEERKLDLLLQLGMIYLAVSVVQSALKLCIEVYRGRLVECVIRDLREMVYRCSFMITPKNSKAPRKEPLEKGAIVSMVAAEVEMLGGFVGQAISVPLLQIGTITSIASYMVWVQPLVAVAALTLYLPQIFFVPYIQGKINIYARARAEKIRAIGQFIVTDGQIVPEDQSTPRNYLTGLHDVYQLRIKIYWLKGILKLFNMAIERAGVLLVLVIGGWLVIEGHSKLGTIVAFLAALYRIGDPWRQLLAFYRALSDARIKYKLLVDTFPTPP